MITFINFEFNDNLSFIVLKNFAFNKTHLLVTPMYNAMIMYL